ncbi:MAG: YceI family protein [Raineya sp.]
MNNIFVWKSDIQHSSLSFSVSHMMIAEVVGFIRKFVISITTSKADFSDAKVEAVLDAGSVFTNIEARDKHLTSADFLDAEKFPQIRFVSTQFKLLENKKIQISGRLSIKEVSLPIQIDAEYTGMQKDPWGNVKAGFKAQTSIRRTSFGLTWNQILANGAWLVGNDIKISFQGEFIKQ